MQVWDKKGRKTFEYKYKRKLTFNFLDLMNTMNIMGNVLIFRPEAGDDECEYYHVIFLESNFHLRIKAPDRVPSCLAFYENMLMIGFGNDLIVYGFSQLDIESKIFQHE